jgi:hypothetical protein
MLNAEFHADGDPYAITTAQVQAAFRAAGLTPLEQPDKMAEVLNAQLTALSPMLENLSFYSEASDFLVALVEEARR